MIDNIGLGPPAQGFPGPQVREASREPREDSSGSFKKTLGEKTDPKFSETSPDGRPGRRLKDPDERPAEVRREKSVEPGLKRAKGAREQAIREFMDSFESEFRIPPTRIVEAMASIEPQKMTEAPEATAKDVIDQLDLAPEDREKAMAMYAGLLSQLQSVDRTVKPVPMMPTENAMMAPQMRERVQSARDHRTAMASAVESLNQKFWMTGSRAASGAVAPPSTPGLKAFDVSKMQVEPEGAFPEVGDESALALDADVLDTVADSNIENSTPVFKGAKPMDVEGRATTQGLSGARKATPGELKRVLEDLRKAAEQLQTDKSLAQADAIEPANEDMQVLGATVSPKPAAGAAVTDASSDTASVAKSFMAQTMPKGQGAGGFGQSSHGGSGGSPKGETSSDGKSAEVRALGLTTPTPLKLEDVAAALKNAAPAGAPSIVANTQEHEANLRQIMNQAQYLIKKGGGEVKVEMSPEGLGNLHLKVLVQDGKVNVQMAAESNEARKAIESSLPELRSSLAAHKLSMDHVKVDVVGAPSTDNQARNDTNNPNPQQHRETRQFWNQFQENFGNRGAREGLWDLPDMKGYRTAKTPPALEPANERTLSVSEKRADGRGRGLNLVA